MRSLKWLKWICVGLLSVGVAFATIGCSDDDDDDDDASGGGTTVVVVTNVVDGTTVVVTNVVEAPPALVAPQLVSPEDGWKVNTLLLAGDGYDVSFEWTAVPGAVAYVFELDGVETVLTGTTTTEELTYGEYEWRVWARNAAGANGPKSAKSSFEIDVFVLPAFPVVPSP